MNTREEIQHALERLSVSDRAAITAWLQEFAEGQYWGCRVEEPTAGYAVPQPAYVTFEEFLESEKDGPERYEYINGVIRAMCIPSVAHCLVTQNLYFALRTRLRNGPCEAFTAGLQLTLKNARDKVVYLPDLMVACERKGWGRNWIHNPKLVIEVLSPSTQHIDRREKAVNYRQIPSVEEYVIAAQNERQLTIYRRAEDWAPEVVTGVAAVAEFRSLGLSIGLAEIYERVLEGPASMAVVDEE